MAELCVRPRHSTCLFAGRVSTTTQVTVGSAATQNCRTLGGYSRHLSVAGRDLRRAEREDRCRLLMSLPFGCHGMRQDTAKPRDELPLLTFGDAELLTGGWKSRERHLPELGFGLPNMAR